MTLTQIINSERINDNNNLIDNDHFLMLQHNNNNNTNQYQINTNFITYNLKRIKKRRLHKYRTVKDTGIESNFNDILNNNQSISLNKTIINISSLTTNTATTTTTTTIKTTAIDEEQRLRQRRQLLSEIFDKHNNPNKMSPNNVASLSTTTIHNNNITIDNNTITDSGYNDTTSSKYQQNINNSTDTNTIGIISSTIPSTISDIPLTNINSTSNPSSSLIGHYIATAGDGNSHNGGGGGAVVGGGAATTIPTHTNRNIIGTGGGTAIITNGKRPTIIIYPTVSPESIVIPIVSCILGFPLLALMVICCLRRRAKLARERDRRRNYDMQDHAVSLVRFSPIHRLNNRSSRVISLRPERSLSRGFPSLELDTVVEERSSDHEQTQTDILSPESPSDPQKYRGFNSS